MNKLITSFLLVCSLSGCTMNAVQYQPDFNLVNHLKDQDLQAIAVGDITEANPQVNKINLRGSPMVSPFNNSYADYLEVALVEQLTQANLYDSSSSINISGSLLENDVNTMGFTVGIANISARFIVDKSGATVYDKVISIRYEWPSSFVGAVAIPNAQNNYPAAIKKLISKFMRDQEFLDVTEK
jgi:hypothetical protein